MPMKLIVKMTEYYHIKLLIRFFLPLAILLTISNADKTITRTFMTKNKLLLPLSPSKINQNCKLLMNLFFKKLETAADFIIVYFCNRIFHRQLHQKVPTYHESFTKLSE